MAENGDQNDRLKALAASLDVPGLTPVQIHAALKLLVDEVINLRNKDMDGGEF